MRERDETHLEKRGTREKDIFPVDFSSVVNLPKLCVICGCRLDCDNRSETHNVCRSCLHDLEF